MSAQLETTSRACSVDATGVLACYSILMSCYFFQILFSSNGFAYYSYWFISGIQGVFVNVNKAVHTQADGCRKEIKYVIVCVNKNPVSCSYE